MSDRTETKPGVICLRDMRWHKEENWSAFLPLRQKDGTWAPGAWTPETEVGTEEEWRARRKDDLLDVLADGGTQAWHCEVANAIERVCEGGRRCFCGRSLRLLRPVERAVLQRAWEACSAPRLIVAVLGHQVAHPCDSAHRALVLCACECARLAFGYAASGEAEPARQVLEVVERWARGEAMLDEVRTAEQRAGEARGVCGRARLAIRSARQAAQCVTCVAGAPEPPWEAWARGVYVADTASIALVEFAIEQGNSPGTDRGSTREAARAALCDRLRAIVPRCPVNATIEGETP